MRAKIFIKIHIDWLFKAANHLRRFVFDGGKGVDIITGGAEISVPFFPASKKWRIACQVNKNIAACFDIICPRFKLKRVPA